MSGRVLPTQWSRLPTLRTEVERTKKSQGAQPSSESQNEKKQQKIKNVVLDVVASVFVLWSILCHKMNEYSAKKIRLDGGELK